MRAIANFLILFCFVVSIHGCGDTVSPSTVFEREQGAKLLFRFEHPDTVCSVLFWPEKEVLVTGCWDDSIRVWNIRTGKPDREWKAQQGGITALAASREGMLASGGSDCSVRVWDGLKSTKVAQFETREVANSLAFSPAEGLLSCTAWFSVYLWDLPKRQPIAESPGNNGVSAVSFSPNGKLLAIGTDHGSVLLLEAPYASLPMENLAGALILDRSPRNQVGQTGDGYAIYSLAFSPDGRTLAAFGEISDLVLWEVLTGKERRRLKTEGAIGFSVAFAPNGNILATGEGWRFWLRGFPQRQQTTSTNNKGEKGNCTRLWDIRSGKPICGLARHEQGTRCVAFSADGKLLATGSEDKTALLWDVSEIMKASEAKEGEPVLGDLEPLWLALTNDDAYKASAYEAFDAILAMSGSPKQSVPFLRTKLRPVATVEKSTVEKLLKDLDSDDFATREHASEELSKLGEGAEPILRDRLSKSASSEARHRIEALIDKVDKCKGHNPPAEVLGALRGIETLERIGSDDAARLLEDLAKGVPWARQTQDAKASLERIKQRRKS